MQVAKEANNDILKYRIIKALWRFLSPEQQRNPQYVHSFGAIMNLPFRQKCRSIFNETFSNVHQAPINNRQCGVQRRQRMVLLARMSNATRQHNAMSTTLPPASSRARLGTLLSRSATFPAPTLSSS
jgi:hypothetical protein